MGLGLARRPVRSRGASAASPADGVGLPAGLVLTPVSDKGHPAGTADWQVMSRLK
jgi:hypothetical protein